MNEALANCEGKYVRRMTRNLIETFEISGTVTSRAWLGGASTVRCQSEGFGTLAAVTIHHACVLLHSLQAQKHVCYERNRLIVKAIAVWALLIRLSM